MVHSAGPGAREISKVQMSGNACEQITPAESKMSRRSAKLIDLTARSAVYGDHCRWHFGDCLAPGVFCFLAIRCLPRWSVGRAWPLLLSPRFADIRRNTLVRRLALTGRALSAATFLSPRPGTRSDYADGSSRRLFSRISFSELQPDMKDPIRWSEPDRFCPGSARAQRPSRSSSRDTFTPAWPAWER